MDEGKRIRSKKTGKVYGDVVDNGDAFLGKVPGQDHYIRIPRRDAVEVGPDAVDEPVKPKKITGGAIMPEDLERVRKEREGKK